MKFHIHIFFDILFSAYMKPNNRGTLTFYDSPSGFYRTAPHPGSGASPTEMLPTGLLMVHLSPIVSFL